MVALDKEEVSLAVWFCFSQSKQFHPYSTLKVKPSQSFSSLFLVKSLKVHFVFLSLLCKSLCYYTFSQWVSFSFEFFYFLWDKGSLCSVVMQCDVMRDVFRKLKPEFLRERWTKEMMLLLLLSLYIFICAFYCAMSHSSSSFFAWFLLMARHTAIQSWWF